MCFVTFRDGFWDVFTVILDDDLGMFEDVFMMICRCFDDAVVMVCRRFDDVLGKFDLGLCGTPGER